MSTTKKSLESGEVLQSNDFFDKIGIRYEQAFGHDPGLHRVAAKFLALLDGDALVLDCGCGTGKPVSKMIVDSGRRVLGIDMSDTMISLSRKQVPQGSFEQANMLLYTPAVKAHGVVANLSLFNLTRDELNVMARNWFQWLRPDGHLLIGVFGAEDSEAKPELYDADGLFASDIPFTFMNHESNMNLFTKAGWNGLLESAGFAIEHVETDLFVPLKGAGCDDEYHYYVIARKASDS